MGIGGGRGSVGDPGGGDHAGATAIGLGQLQQGGHRFAAALAAIALLGGVAVHADDAVVALDPGHVGRHGGGRVGHLSIVGEGLDEGSFRQGVDGEAALFADAIDPGGGEGVETHAVAEEEDHVLGAGFRGVAVVVGVAAGGQGGAYHHCKSCHLSHWGSLLVKPERSLEGADDTFSEER